MVENVGVAFAIASLSHSVQKLFLLPCLESSILNSVDRPMSGNVVSDTGRPGVDENVGVAFGIASLSHSVQKLFLLPV